MFELDSYARVWNGVPHFIIKDADIAAAKDYDMSMVLVTDFLAIVVVN